MKQLYYLRPFLFSIIEYLAWTGNLCFFVPDLK